MQMECHQTLTKGSETCLRYVYEIVPEFSNVNSNVVQKYIEQVFPEGSEIAMTLAEVLRDEGFEKGILKGEETGLEKGKKEGLLELAVEHLSLKFGVLPTDCQEKIASLDLKMLQIFNINIGNFKSIEDVKKFLGI